MSNVFTTIKHILSLVKRLVRDTLKVIVDNISLFLGIGMTVATLFSFSSGRYCDGNPADYYSCTRPATYYYYSEIAIVLLVIGVFLIVAWFLKRDE